MKTVFAPLSIAIVLALASVILLLRQWKRLSSSARLACVTVCLGTMLLVAASLPAVADALYMSLYREIELSPAEEIEGARAIVVLRGDYPSRIMKAVEVFKRSRASYLVLSGYAGPERPYTPGNDPWQAFAIAAGVPPSSIIVEERSMSTFEHPAELLKIKGFERSTRICVVTSTWHMPRAYAQFRRSFDSVAVAPDAGPAGELSISSFVPRAEALHRSTLMMQERIGSIWYWFRNEWR
ncbi:MAG TPA: YdcF family protein [Thermodesulfobacteriota bacterium]